MGILQIFGAIIQGCVLVALLLVLAYHLRLVYLAWSSSDSRESSALAVIFVLCFVSAVLSQYELFPIGVSPWLFACIVAINIALVVLRKVLVANRESDAN